MHTYLLSQQHVHVHVRTDHCRSQKWSSQSFMQSALLNQTKQLTSCKQQGWPNSNWMLSNNEMWVLAWQKCTDFGYNTRNWLHFRCPPNEVKAILKYSDNILAHLHQCSQTEPVSDLVAWAYDWRTGPIFLVPIPPFLPLWLQLVQCSACPWLGPTQTSSHDQEWFLLGQAERSKKKKQKMWEGRQRLVNGNVLQWKECLLKIQPNIFDNLHKSSLTLICVLEKECTAGEAHSTVTTNISS